MEIGTMKIQMQTVRLVKSIFTDEQGATAIEYGLIAALISVAAITAMTGLGNQMKATYNNTSSAMSVANAGA